MILIPSLHLVVPEEMEFETFTKSIPNLLSIIDLSNRCIITGLIRMFTFWRLQIRHTCCNLWLFVQEIYDFYDGEVWNPIAMQDGFPNPTPLHSAKKRKRIHREDRHLIKVLERLVPDFDQAYDDIGQPFKVFLESHMLPIIDAELVRLAKEDHERFSKGHEKLGVRMEPSLKQGF